MRLIGYFLLLICLSSEVLAKDIVDDDPRRTVLLEQPRLEVISTILETYYDKGSAEDLYKIYKSEPSAFEEMHVDSRTSDGQKFSRIFKFRNPNGKFQAAPFERGYGVTLGNSLRRVLLSSIEGSAVEARCGLLRQCDVRLRGCPLDKRSV